MYPSRRQLTILGLFIVIALSALTLHQLGRLQPLEHLAFAILQPFFSDTVDVQQALGGALDSLDDINTLRAEVADLQSQVDDMKTDRLRLQELEIENATLRQQLGYKQSNTGVTLVGSTVLGRNPDVARILGLDPSNLVRFILIDQGSAEGVKEGMPVLTPQGLVGRVWTAGVHSSKVLLIIDPSSSVNAVVQSTRATGVVQGDLSGNLVGGNLLMKYVPQGDAIKPGDTILTSGLGGNFPKRLVIGKVAEVHKSDIQMFQEAVVEPSVDFSRLEFVMVLKNFTPSDISSEPAPTPTSVPKK